MEEYTDVEKLKRKEFWAERGTIVFLSDFGTLDGAVSAMHGVADLVDHSLRIEDLTHEIPQFNIWEASYRLIQTIPYWAPGTVFVSVVDPGVGSDRESVAVLTKSGHIIVTPDNGTLSHVRKGIGILERRSISEKENRLKNSTRSYTFHGRDIYAYTGAKLASGHISFDEVGPLLSPEPVMLGIHDPIVDGDSISGSIDILDTRYGSLWTNIPDTLFFSSLFEYGGSTYVTIEYKDRVVYGKRLKICHNFTEVEKGEGLVYINSLLNVGLAVNQGSFSREYNISTGENWKITFSR